jgi:hypothetical protein
VGSGKRSISRTFETDTDPMVTLSVGHHRPGAAVASARDRAGAEESAGSGLRLGLLMGTVAWLWVAASDAVLGHPFQTFSVLGGIAAFTIVHYILNLAYGAAAMSFVRGALRAPSLIIGLIFIFIIFEVAFAMLTVLLSHSAIGMSAWLVLYGGNAASTAAGAWYISRRYPLGELLHQAEEER